MYIGIALNEDSVTDFNTNANIALSRLNRNIGAAIIKMFSQYVVQDIRGI